ncbi:MAG: M1 family metallopeptidase [Cyclobacteriaceae bacterium]
MKIVIFATLFFLNGNILISQAYWQQRVSYEISIDFDDKKHQYTGTEELTYFNNSPDTLKKLYYHLYLNAFQPNSMMDIRSQNLPDPDARVEDRIGQLSKNEIGFLKVNSLSQNQIPVNFETSETILEVTLAEPILPRSSSILLMDFTAQLPLQIRRTGRNSLEGIDYSVAQWYPKVAEYDVDGWHTSPYIAREFYAPWGDFDVKISIDSDYILAGTGILQNRNEIGYGYEDSEIEIKNRPDRITWHFRAKNVHDFVWAADKEYTQTTAQVPNGPLLRFFYVPSEETKHWETLPDFTVQAFEFVEENFGKYGWEEYSVIQGGDGGMEYPMATLIANKKLSGVRSYESLVGVVCHELVHSWYQGMLATNESLFAWMDEGFTDYAEEVTKQHIFDTYQKDPFQSIYETYSSWVKTGLEEPASTHADHFSSNMAYRRASYTKGALALHQLGYVIGDSIRDLGLLRYYDLWSFKHPDMNKFIRVMEDVSDLELSWYFEYWINTSKYIDYEVSSVAKKGVKTQVTLTRIGEMPMPIDLEITLKDGSKSMYYIPLSMMLGEKKPETNQTTLVGKQWPWTHPSYELLLDTPIKDIEEIRIDPSNRLMDINRENNSSYFN